MDISRSILGVIDRPCLGFSRLFQVERSLALTSHLSPGLASRRIWTGPLFGRQRIVTTASSGGKSNGSNNRLGPSKQQQQTNFSLPTRSAAAGTSSSSSPSSSPSGLFDLLFNSLDEFIGKTLYKYYNWRQDTLSDLQLFVVLNAVVIVLGAALKGQLAPSASSTIPDIPVDTAGLENAPLPPPSWWQDLYSVLTVVLGQELPEEQASNFPQQLFAVATAVLGVASFALVLALIEQATLELLENNVRRGSRVYEKDHYVIATYGESARDLSQCQTMTEQICAASASSGGAVIVILVAHREKLEMETLFRETLPLESRCGSQIVFRQGSPLDPGALEMVSATDARAIIVSGDYSRSVEDSDAQALRCAVLIDEMTAAAGKEWIDTSIGGSGTVDSSSPYAFGSTNGLGPWVIAEVQGPNVRALLEYACTSRVIPVSTTAINARRLARLLRHPAIATLSHALFDYKSRSNCHVGYFPDANWLIGKKFSELHAYFPDAIVSGIINIATWKSELSCPPERVLQKGEALVMLRQYSGAQHPVRPVRHAVPAVLDPGSNWEPNSYSLRSVDENPLGKDASGARVCSWTHTPPPPTITSPTNEYSSPRAPPPRGPADHFDLAGADTSGDDEGISIRRKTRRYNNIRSNSRLSAALLPLSYGSTSTETNHDGGDGNNPNSSSLHIGSDLLICGWPGSTAMLEILRELDHGSEALPQGSRVILLNNHSWSEVCTQCSLATTIQRLEIKHVKCDPRDRQALATALDVATLRAAVILHDTNWGLVGGGGGGSSSGSFSNGCFNNNESTATTIESSINANNTAAPYRAAAEASAYSLSQSDMLRMDAAVLEVQLNVRYLLETSCCPDINILSEKLTYLGQTRFENRNELPIGAAINSASFAAKVLAQTAVQPRSLTAYAQVGVQTEIVVQDAAAFAREGEELNFYTLQARCASVAQCLLGYYDLPNSIDQVLNIVVNPDQEDRMVKRVWNDGNSRCKLITLAPRTAVAKALKKQPAVAVEEAVAAVVAGDEKLNTLAP